MTTHKLPTDNQIQITFRPMAVDEAWDFLKTRHSAFHTRLKHSGYGYKWFAPDDQKMHEMFERENLPPEQISEYRDIFINRIYSKERLQEIDEILEKSTIPVLKRIAQVLSPMVKRWGVRLPDSVEILTTYGSGGMYGNKRIVFGMTNFSKETDIGSAVNVFIAHEFIHLLIEEPIIQKYNVPHDLKERIVDIIGFEYFNIPIQKRFENSFADKYITIEAIENDLPGAVKRMMDDYAVHQAKVSLK